MKRALALAALLLACTLLPACGGGGEQEPEPTHTPRLNCTAEPRKCL